MDDRIVNFADMAFKLRGRRVAYETQRCAHSKVTLDDNGGIVTCDACGKQLDPYWTLRNMAERWEQHASDHKHAAQRIAEDAKAIVHLRAAKAIERIWRRGMAPLCPHCKEPILLEDGLGNSSVSRAYIKRNERSALSACPSQPEKS